MSACKLEIKRIPIHKLTLMSVAQQFEISHPPSDAISSLKFAPGSSTRLIVSSWDSNVYLYDLHGQSGGQLLQKFEHRAPVLDVCFGEDEKVAFSAGLDQDVRKLVSLLGLLKAEIIDANMHYRVDLETGEQTVLSTHEAGVKSVVYSPETCTSFLPLFSFPFLVWLNLSHRSNTHLRIMGQNASHPHTLDAQQSPGHDPTSSQALLHVFNGDQARGSHGLTGGTHL